MATSTALSIEVYYIIPGLGACVVGLLGVVWYFARRALTESEKRDKEIENQINENRKERREDINKVFENISQLRSDMGDDMQILKDHLEKEAQICFDSINKRIDKIEKDCENRYVHKP